MIGVIITVRAFRNLGKREITEEASEGEKGDSMGWRTGHKRGMKRRDGKLERERKKREGERDRKTGRPRGPEREKIERKREIEREKEKREKV